MHAPSGPQDVTLLSAINKDTMCLGSKMEACERKDEGDWVSACRNMVVPKMLERVDHGRGGGAFWRTT